MSEPKKTFYVNYCDEINIPKVKSIMAIFAEIITKEKPDTIYCLFSSSGGLVEAGITLYNYLRSLPIELIMHNTGSIDSIANVIFLAADTRYTAKHSSFMYHGVTWNFAANTSLTRNQLSETISGIDSSQSKIAGIITEKTKLTAEEIGSLFSQGETKDAAFALDKGIVREIRDPQIPKGAPFFSFNLT